MKKFLATALCALTIATAGTALAEGERIVFVGHWPKSDPFFNVIRNSAQLAADQVDAKIEFRNPSGGDLAEMARLINQASASQPDAIIATVPDASIVSAPLANAVGRGIPVVIVNSGSSEIAAEIGALRYIGQAEYDAGRAAGVAAKEAGATSFVCVNHFYSHQASRDRCRGFADGLEVELGNQEIDAGSDPNDVLTRTAAFLSSNPDTQAILTLGPTGADPLIKWVRDQGVADNYVFATFDLSADIVKGIEDGIVNVAVDQQPFIQGYEAVTILTNHLRYGVTPANDIASGPGLVTADNLGAVLDHAGRYR